jgi:glycosyltransferase involved in cell wall biosynthesis
MALMAGFDMAKGSHIITMGDDLQHPPVEIPKLIRAQEENLDTDVVIGKFAKKEHDFYRNLGSSLVHAIYAYTHGRPKQLRMSNFKIMRREVVETIRSHQTARPISNALLLQSTKKIVNIVVDHHPRPYGNSGYSLFRLINSMLDQVVYSSTDPLRMLGLTGFGISAGSVILRLYYLVRWFAGNVGITGFTTLVLLLFFGGMLLFSLGMVGEYVARVLKEVVGNPRYVVRQTANVTDLGAPDKKTRQQRNRFSGPNIIGGIIS